MAGNILIFGRDVKNFTQAYEQSRPEAIQNIGKNGMNG